MRYLYSRSPKVGNPIASTLKSNVWGIPALFGLNPVSNFMGFIVLFGKILRTPNTVSRIFGNSQVDALTS